MHRVTISRGDRRCERAPRAFAEFGGSAGAALDILELVELAFHDCYGEVSPPPAVIDDICVVGGGDLPRFASAARLAVDDFRDLRVTADSNRRRSG